MVHPHVTLVLKAVEPGTTLRGRGELVQFLEKEFPRRLWETVVHLCTPLDENRVVVEGRIRWMDDRRVLRDDRRIWAVEFRDGLLLRSIPALTVADAEAILASVRDASPGESPEGT